MSEPSPETPAPGWRRWLRPALAVALAALVVLGLTVLPLGRYVVALLDQVESLGWWGPLVLALAYVPGALFAIPGSLLTLGAGLLFGVTTGTIAVSLGSTLGALAAFAVARRLGSQAVARRVEGSARFRAIARAIEGQGLRIVLLTRLSPIFPYTFLNYAFGLTTVRTRDYLLGSWLGMLPGTVMYVYLGSALSNLSQLASGQGLEGGAARQALFWGGLAATVAVTVVVTRIARRALREAAEDPTRADDEESP